MDKELKQGSAFYKNPSFLVKEAIKKVLSHSFTNTNSVDKYIRAKELLTQAIHLEPKFAAPAFYARAIVMLKEGKWASNNEDEIITAQEIALADLNAATNAVNNVYSRSIKPVTDYLKQHPYEQNAFLAHKNSAAKEDKNVLKNAFDTKTGKLIKLKKKITQIIACIKSKTIYEVELDTDLNMINFMLD
uniref:Uncharacterized protein n=1 Tax=Ditylenchus dipsaci TaxID=166011 RepID=A0A915CWK2_9BILA